MSAHGHRLIGQFVYVIVPKPMVSKRRLAGAIGDIPETVFAVTPIETLKIRVTYDLGRGTGKYKGSVDAMVKILKSGGPMGRYKEVEEHFILSCCRLKPISFSVKLFPNSQSL